MVPNTKLIELFSKMVMELVLVLFFVKFFHVERRLYFLIFKYLQIVDINYSRYEDLLNSE